MLTQANLKELWINADVQWGSLLPTGGCDEGCAAYVMVELISVTTNSVIPGYEKEKCVLLNITGTRIPLVWEGGVDTAGRSVGVGGGTGPSGVDGGRAADEAVPVQARVYFRDATVYAIGTGDL